MITKKLRSALALILSASLMSGTSLSALSFTGLGEVDDISRDYIGSGLTYTSYTSTDENGKTQNAYIFDYDHAKGGVLPIVRWGSKIYGMDRLGSLVSTEGNEGKTVLGAVNGDFYSMQTGVPMGVMIDGGRLITTDDSKYAVGFLSNGSAMIGKPEISISMVNLTKSSEPIEIRHLNKYPSMWGAYMLTEDFGATTHSTSESLEIVIELDGDIKASGTVTGTVTQVETGVFNISIPEGCAVISVDTRFESYSTFTGIEQGDTVQINTSCANGWDTIHTAVGSGDLILANGVMPDGIIDEEHEKVSNPRTAIGLRPDGTTVFFAVDGRSGKSRGLKLSELSAVMSELGCTYAVNLDGGGSTTVMMKPSLENECVYVNTASDPNYRALANGILLVSAKESDGVPGALSISPNLPYILKGSTIDFTATVLDSAFIPLDETVPTEELTAEFKKDYKAESEDIDPGSVSGGSYTAGTTGGEYFFTVSKGDLSGEVSVMVADKLDSLLLKPSYIKIKPGTLVELDIEAMYKDRIITCDAGSFYYTLNGEHNVPNPDSYPGALLLDKLGILDSNGNFQSFGGDYEGEVEVGVWFDELVSYTKINIGNSTDIVADFETEEQIESITSESENGSIFAYRTDLGFKSDSSLAVIFSYEDADMDKVAKVNLGEPYVIGSHAEHISLWAYGDISGIPMATVTDRDGNEYDLSYTVTKDYSKQLGWRELTAKIPESIRENGMLYLTTLFSLTDSFNGSRSIAIDNATVYYGAPEIPALTGLTEHWAASHLYSLYDMGVIQDFDCEDVDGELYYDPDKALTRGEFAKLLVLWTGTNAEPYVENGIKVEDTTPADKIPYIRAAVDYGFMSGRGTLEDGTVIFDAGANITRQEAFKVIGSLLTSAEAELNFTDAASVADWAKQGVSKCVSIGIVNGYLDGTIRPGANITRSEFSAVLAKIK